MYRSIYVSHAEVPCSLVTGLVLDLLMLLMLRRCTCSAWLIVSCIITACVLLDTVRHPTGPYPAPPTIPAEGVARNPAYLIKAKNGAVASENIVCSEIGIDVLKEGGNAVDAAIASTFCIGVVNLFSCVSFLPVVVLQNT